MIERKALSIKPERPMNMVRMQVRRAQDLPVFTRIRDEFGV
jgi:hypothetical protein